jgi:hypothetical protein
MCTTPPPPQPMNCNALCFMELHDPLPSQCIALFMLSIVDIWTFHHVFFAYPFVLWDPSPFTPSPSTRCYSNLVCCNLIVTCPFCWIWVLAIALTSL